MRIGLDFDNTIVSYDTLFHKVALEQSLVPTDTPVNKLSVRDYLRRIGQEDRWTEMQGYVYGARMAEAEAYNGAIDFIRKAKQAGHTLAIMSHKTRYPFMGPQYDLHVAASDWISQNLLCNDEDLIPHSQIFFELTKQEKIARIAEFECDVFIDDLPEILLFEGFPATTKRLLFDPECHHSKISHPEIATFSSWQCITDHIIA